VGDQVGRRHDGDQVTRSSFFHQRRRDGHIERARVHEVFAQGGHKVGAMSSMLVSISVTLVWLAIVSPIQTARALPGVSRAPIP